MQRPSVVLVLQLAALIAVASGASTTIKLYRKNTQLDSVASRASQNVVCKSPDHELTPADFYYYKLLVCSFKSFRGIRFFYNILLRASFWWAALV